MIEYLQTWFAISTGFAGLVLMVGFGTLIIAGVGMMIWAALDVLFYYIRGRK